jgi:hypothetical protein
MVLSFRRFQVVFFLVLLPVILQANPDPGIAFVENAGQWSLPFHFAARVPGGRMFVHPGGFTYYFLDEQKIALLHDAGHELRPDLSLPSDSFIGGQAIAVGFVGANHAAVPQPFGVSPTYYNFFLGDDTCRWASKVPAYEGVLYQSVYPGIDLKVYGTGSNVKYDFVVSPGADLSQIVMRYGGMDELQLRPDGDLWIHSVYADITEKKPIAYQFINGTKQWVDMRFSVHDNVVGFVPEGNYDPCFPLTIDPLLIFSTYSGSTADNWGSTATPGERGSLYSAGVTSPTGNDAFPSTTGAFQVSAGGLYDIGILKYDSTGSQLLYATYLGGSESESPHSLVVNENEELVVLGTTSSLNFPTTLGVLDRSFNGGLPTSHVIPYNRGSDIFISRISKDGSSLLASTYLGGNANDGLNPSGSILTRNYGDQLRGDVITDTDGNIYFSSVTSSTNFPIVNGVDNTYNGGATDALLVKLNAALSTIIWSTFLGGANADASHTLQFDSEGNLITGGGTASTNFPVTASVYQAQFNGGVDGWIARISKDGDAILHATYTGTSAFDQVYFIDLNESGEIYAYGQTSGQFPVTPGVYNNPNSGQFVQKFDAELKTMIFSTVVGSGRGIPDISPTAFLVNDCNNIYLSGWGGAVNIENEYWQSNTLGMPITPDAYQSTSTGSDFYFMVLTDDATQFLHGTYLGGVYSRTHVDGGTSRFDKNGIVYHAVCAGCAAYNPEGEATSDFPTTKGAWSRINGSENCNNAAFKFDLSSLKARIQPNAVTLDMPGLTKYCVPDQVVFQNISIGGEIFQWNFGDGTALTTTDTSMIIHDFPGIGSYKVSLVAIDQGTCQVKDSTGVQIDIFDALTEVQGDDALCLGTAYTLRAAGGAVYKWKSADGTFESSQARPTVSPTDTTRYYITIIERSGCFQRDTVDLAVVPLIAPHFEIERSAECFERPVVIVRNVSDSLRVGDVMFFDFGDGSTDDQMEGVHSYDADGLYTVRLVGIREFCTTEITVPMPVFSLLIPNVITPGLQDSANDHLTIQFGDSEGATPGDFGFRTNIVVYNRWGGKVFESHDYQYDWDAEGLVGGIYYIEVEVEGHATCKTWVQVVK